LSILWWLKTENISNLPGTDQEQITEMKSVVAAANAAIRPAQNVVSKKHATTRRLRNIPTSTGNKLLNEINWKIRNIKMQRIFYIRKSRN